jgi:hypothetical protein
MTEVTPARDMNHIPELVVDVGQGTVRYSQTTSLQASLPRRLEGEDDRQLVRPCAAYLGEQIRGSFRTVAVDDEAIEVPPNQEFDCTRSVCAHFEFDIRCTEADADNLQQRHVASRLPKLPKQIPPNKNAG